MKFNSNHLLTAKLLRLAGLMKLHNYVSSLQGSGDILFFRPSVCPSQNRVRSIT